MGACQWHSATPTLALVAFLALGDAMHSYNAHKVTETVSSSFQQVKWAI
jgi:hypothetical protein